jgi:hypothetical protein
MFASATIRFILPLLTGLILAGLLLRPART